MFYFLEIMKTSDTTPSQGGKRSKIHKNSRKRRTQRKIRK